jgi:hypothetical protein
VWTLEPEKSVWKSKLMHHSIEEVSLPQGTFLQVFASGDVLQELDVVATMCARSCMLHPSLQFIAELEVINFPPAINVISSGKRMSTHDKLVSRYGSEFDYVVEDGSTVTHVLVNSKNLKMMAVAELYIAINGVMKTLPQVLASRLMTKPWPIENSEPLIMQNVDDGFRFAAHPLVFLKNLVVYVEIRTIDGIFACNNKLAPSEIVDHLLAAVNRLKIQYDIHHKKELLQASPL